jgi:YbbR domain-containing protein
VTVTVDVIQRDDVRELDVRPFILFNTLIENYQFDNLNDWEPRKVLISGSPDALSRLGSTVDTQPISLEGRTTDFTVEVPLDLPAGEFIVLSGNGTITVDIAISEEAATISLENVPVSVIGIPEGSTATPTPAQISVVVNGPESLINDLKAADIQAVVDANGLAPGTTDIVPQINIRQGQINLTDLNVTLLPARVSVTLVSPTPESTEPVQAEQTSTPSDP